jgi:hypothetical protein
MIVMDANLSVRPVDPAVEAEMDRLTAMPIAGLRVRYREVFRSDPPKAFGPDLLRRSIAHRIQEKAYGGLSRPALRLLDQMMKAYAAKPVAESRCRAGSSPAQSWSGNGRAGVIASWCWRTVLPMMARPLAISPKSRF